MLNQIKTNFRIDIYKSRHRVVNYFMLIRPRHSHSLNKGFVGKNRKFNNTLSTESIFLRHFFSIKKLIFNALVWIIQS